MTYPIGWYDWYNKKRQKHILKVKSIVNLLIKDPFLKQSQIAKLVKASRPTVCKILQELEDINALRKVQLPIAGSKVKVYKYEISPQFVKFLDECATVEQGVQDAKPRGFASGEAGDGEEQKEVGSIEVSKGVFSNPDELNEWCRNGYFRIHGFQRKFVLKNYRLIDSEDKWYTLANLLWDGRTIDATQVVQRILIGRKKNAPTYVIKVPSKRFPVEYKLHFKKNCVIVSLPKEQSIYVPWEEFSKDLKQLIERDIKETFEDVIKVYCYVFNQQVLAYDGGWVGQKKPLEPEVAYVDPDGVIRKVYESHGSIYIEKLGYWVDGSISQAPELEFDSIETASKFKKAIDVLADEDFEEAVEKIKDIDEKLEELKMDVVKFSAEVMKGAMKEAIKTAIEETMPLSHTGIMNIQQQLTEMWKRIADMQLQLTDMLETLQLVVAVSLLKDDGEDNELKLQLREKLLRKLGLLQR